MNSTLAEEQQLLKHCVYVYIGGVCAQYKVQVTCVLEALPGQYIIIVVTLVNVEK